MMLGPILLWIILPGLVTEKLGRDWLGIKDFGGVGAILGGYLLFTYGPWAPVNIL